MCMYFNYNCLAILALKKNDVQLKNQMSAKNKMWGVFVKLKYDKWVSNKKNL